MNNKSILIVSASGTSQIAKPLSEALGIPWIGIETTKFPNEELRLNIPTIGDTTILIGSLSQPVNTRIVEYLLAADAIKRGGCKKLVGVLSWFAYSKQDKVFLEGEPLSAKVIADMLQSVQLDELYTLDIHSSSIADYFKIPVHNISAAPLFVEYLRHINLKNTVAVSPDKGSVSNSTNIAKILNIPLIHAQKTRDLHTGVVSFLNLDGDVTSKNVLIFDDMIASGSTLVEIGNYLHQKGAAHIMVCSTHHLYVKNAQQKLDHSYIDKIIVSNSIVPGNQPTSTKLEILDIHSVFAKNLAQYHLI